MLSEMVSHTDSSSIQRRLLNGSTILKMVHEQHTESGGHALIIGMWECI